MIMLAISYTDPFYRSKAEALALELNLPIDQAAGNKLLVDERLKLEIYPFTPLGIDFNFKIWEKKAREGKKRGLIKACVPEPGRTIIDATAGWGRDAALLASFGAKVIMIERHPIMAVLLQEAINRELASCLPRLNLSLIQQNSLEFLQNLKTFPHVIYLDPMHPLRQKKALVKKELQVLQQLIGPDPDAAELLNLAQQRVLETIVLKWPAHLPPLVKPDYCISGKTIRFDCYTALR